MRLWHQRRNWNTFEKRSNIVDIRQAIARKIVIQVNFTRNHPQEIRNPKACRINEHKQHCNWDSKMKLHCLKWPYRENFKLCTEADKDQVNLLQHSSRSISRNRTAQLWRFGVSANEFTFKCELLCAKLSCHSIFICIKKRHEMVVI